MRKITSFLMLLVAFALTVTSLSAQTIGYKPGVRKTSFAQGDKMFIYNTCFSGTKDRTGFYRYNSKTTQVELVKQKPYSTTDNCRYDVGGTSIWTVESVKNVGTEDEPIYKMSIKNCADQYLTFNMNYSADVQYVYVRLWKNTSSNKLAIVKSEAADGSIILNRDIMYTDDVWTVSQYQNVTSGNFWTSNESSVLTSDRGYPFAFYTLEEMTDDEFSSIDSELNATKAAVVSGIKTVLNDCGVTVKLTPLKLTADNTTSNADENTGVGIASLIDQTDNDEPDLTTYFHSRWSGTAVDDYHYIQVDAGEAISAFAFGYSTRNGGLHHPTAFDIFGSSDGTSWTKIASIDKETFALKGTSGGATETYAQRGFVLPSGTTYQYFRFAVTANTSGEKFNDYPFFELADFNFSKVEFSCKESYMQNASVLLNNYLLKQEVEAILPNVTDLEGAVFANTQKMVDNQFFADASKQPALPFNLTTDNSNKQNYYITTCDGMYYSLRPWESGKIYLDASYETAGNNAYRYWYFTRSEMTGALYIHPVTAPTEMVGFSNTDDGVAKIFNNSTATSRKFCYVESGSNQCLRPFGATTYVSNPEGSEDAMGFYNDATNDGTKVEFIPAGSLPDNIVDLSAKYVTIKNNMSTWPAESLIGNNLNQYNQSQIDLYDQAEPKLIDEANTLTKESISDFLNGFNFTMLEMNQPAPNGFYRFRNVNSSKYLTTKLTGSSMAMAADATSAAIFYLTSDNKLVGYDNGYYTHNFSGADYYGFQDASGKGNVVTFPNGNTYTEATACYHINCGNRSIYGKGATLDAGHNVATSNTDTGYDWTIEAVSALPLTISKVGWSTFYAPVPVTIPAGVTAYTASIDGTTCTLTEVTGTVPENQGLILYKQGGGDVEMTIAESSDQTLNNNLTGGTNTSNPETGYTYYALQKNSSDASKVGLYQYAGTLKGFRAFYRTETAHAVAGFSFDFITGLEIILGTDGKAGSGEIYDLNGRRLDKPVKGLNIIGGKKVLVK